MSIRRASIVTGSIFTVALVWSIASAFAATRVVYVDAHAKSGGTGRSWNDAYRSLDDALRAARTGDQVWVADGTYTPTSGRDRSRTFDVPEGVAVYGGFSGNERELDDRDWIANPTILSGDIGQPGQVEDNSYHVVVVHEAVVVDGFTIRDGYSLNALPTGAPGRGGPPSGPPPMSGPPPKSGPPSGPPPGPGGQPVHVTPEMLLESLQPGFGAGLAAFKVDTLTVRNVLFTKNSAMAGGAMYNLPNVASMDDIAGNRSNVRVVGVRFVDNYAEKRGGAVIDNLGASPTFVDTVFQDNECADKGGAVYDDFRSSPQFYNVLFSGNRAFRGAAMGNDGGSNPIVVNGTFVHNVAEDVGAGLYQGTGGSPNEPTVVSSIVWGNTGGRGSGQRVRLAPLDGALPEARRSRAAAEDRRRARVPGSAQRRTTRSSRGRSSPTQGIGYDPNRSGASLVGTGEVARGSAHGRARVPCGVEESRRAEGRRVRDREGAGKRDGSSWANAFASLQGAIDAAARSTRRSGSRRARTFRREAIAGRASARGRRRDLRGFSGVERSLAERDRDHATILSGDLGRKGERADNAFHVLEGANGVVLDRLTIEEGNADGTLYDSRGGGLVSYDEHTRTLPGRAGEGFTDVVVRDVTFRNNAAKEGGALYAFGTSQISFERVRFEDNVADYGGALVLRVDVDARFVESSFVGNRSTWQGGAAYLDYGVRPTFEQCEFTANQAGSHGGAVYLTTRASQVEETKAAFDDCTFEQNRSGGRGGAISNFDQGRLEIARTSFDGNEADLGGGAVATDRESTTALSQVSIGKNRGGEGDPDLATDRTSRFSCGDPLEEVVDSLDRLIAATPEWDGPHPYRSLRARLELHRDWIGPRRTAPDARPHAARTGSARVPIGPTTGPRERAHGGDPRARMDRRRGAGKPRRRDPRAGGRSRGRRRADREHRRIRARGPGPPHGSPGDPSRESVGRRPQPQLADLPRARDVAGHAIPAGHRRHRRRTRERARGRGIIGSSTRSSPRGGRSIARSVSTASVA
jgi:predicted outer membrane repeat protein